MVRRVAKEQVGCEFHVLPDRASQQVADAPAGGLADRIQAGDFDCRVSAVGKGEFTVAEAKQALAAAGIPARL
mgnify:CR=1 FL=1